MDPKHGRYYEVNVLMELEDDKGRIKEQSVKYLVDADDTTMAEQNTMKLLDGAMYDWEKSHTWFLPPPDSAPR